MLSLDRAASRAPRLRRRRSAASGSAVAFVALANAAGLLFAPLAGAALSAQLGLTTTLVRGAGVLLAATVGAPTDRMRAPAVETSR